MRPFGSVRTSNDRSGPRRVAARRIRLALVSILAVGALSACSPEQLPRLGMHIPVTNQGPRILLLWQTSWLAALIVGAIVWGLIIWAVVRYRRRGNDDPLPKQTRYNLPIEVFYTIVPFIIIAVLFFYTARDESEIQDTSKPADVHINVNGFQWSWQFIYKDDNVAVTGTPGQLPTLVLPRGERVEFELTSQDVIHSFWVPAFLYKMDVIPGRHNTFQVVPTRDGEFAGKCAELCGEFHARMLFNVKIVEPGEYQQYIATLKQQKTGSTS